jgi:hypothetical protein
MDKNLEETKERRRRGVSKLLDPSRFTAGAVAAVAAFVLQLLVPPVVNPQLESLQGYLVKGGTAVVVFLMTALLPKEGRTPLRIFVLSVITIVFISGSAFVGSYFLSIKDALATHQRAARWNEVLNDTFVARHYFATRSTDVNGSGNATTGGGLLTLRLRSTHVANQQFLVTDVAPSGQSYYVETSVRSQSGPFGSGCFLAFGVLDSNRYFLLR